MDVVQPATQQILIQSFFAGGEKLINSFFRVGREVILCEEGPLVFHWVYLCSRSAATAQLGKGSCLRSLAEGSPSPGWQTVRGEHLGCSGFYSA